MFIGGLVPEDGLPQHKIPYDNGDEFPPPASNILEILLLFMIIERAPGFNVIPLPDKLSPVIVKPFISTLEILLFTKIPVVYPEISKITLA